MTERNRQAIFVGEERHQAVERLVAAFDRVAGGGGPELVCLVAPIGWGKTRIVQELYTRLAAERQSDPAYWPPSIVEATDVTEPTKLRKRVHPGRFEVPGGAVPSWMWWALSCQRKADGQPVQAIEESKEQLFAQAEALEQSLTKVQRLRLGLTPDQVRGKASALAGLLGVFVPPVGWAATVHDSVSQLYDLGQGVFEARRRQERLESARIVDAEQSDRSALVDELASSLVRLSTEPAPLPVVVIVDDAHEAAPSTVALVERLLASPAARVLVVATAWPDALALQAQERRDFGGWLDEFDPDGSCRVALAALLEVDLERLVRAVAPSTASEVVGGLVERSGGNPFVLGLILSLPVVRRSIADGAITLSPAQTASVPNEVRRLYLEKWNDLPEPVREALAVASVQGAVFVEDCAREAALALGLDAVADALPQARDPYAWVRSIDDAVRAFIEAAQFDVTAQAAHEEVLSEHEIDRVRAALVDYVLARREDGTFGDLTEDAQRHLLQQHVVLAEEGLVDDLGAAGRSAFLLGEAAAARYAYWAAIEEGNRARRWLERSLGPDHPDTLGTRNDMAFWLDRSGRMGEAVAQFKALLADQSRVLGSDHPDTLRTRGNLAASLGGSGRVVEAVAQFEVLLADQLRVLGADHPDTLTTRSNLAFWLGEAGRATEAVAQFEMLLVDHTRVLGADHPDTLTTRNNVAFWLGEAGRVVEAVAQSEVLLADRTRVLGADHPATLRTRGNLAAWLGEMGRVVEAVAQFEVLLADQLRVLGADHPDTLRTRGNLEYWRQQSER